MLLSLLLHFLIPFTLSNAECRHRQCNKRITIFIHEVGSMADQPAPTNRFRGKAQPTEAPNVKTLKIKVNALKRTIKDLEFAKKEVEVEKQRLQTFKETNTDKVPQQENVVSEAAMMVPHSGNRIRACVKDLQEYLEKEGALIDDAELKTAAQEAIEAGESAVADS